VPRERPPEHRFQVFGNTPSQAIDGVLRLAGPALDANLKRGQCARVYVTARAGFASYDEFGWSAMVCWPCEPTEETEGQHGNGTGNDRG